MVVLGYLTVIPDVIRDLYGAMATVSGEILRQAQDDMSWCADVCERFIQKTKPGYRNQRVTNPAHNTDRAAARCGSAAKRLP